MRNAATGEADAQPGGRARGKKAADQQPIAATPAADAVENPPSGRRGSRTGP
jgi:hypothetical protein